MVCTFIGSTKFCLNKIMFLFHTIVIGASKKRCVSYRREVKDECGGAEWANPSQPEQLCEGQEAEPKPIRQSVYSQLQSGMSNHVMMLVKHVHTICRRSPTTTANTVCNNAKNIKDKKWISLCQYVLDVCLSFTCLENWSSTTSYVAGHTFPFT